jgi:alpha-1,2-mannosyltransferase
MATRNSKLGLARAAGLTGALALAATATATLAERHNSVDLRVYYGAVSAWRHGQDLYGFTLPPGDRLAFTYPPFAAELLLPLTLLSRPEAVLANRIAIAAATVLTSWMLVRPVAERRGWPRWYALAVAVPLAAVLAPVRETFAFGQVNLYLAALVLLDVALLRRGSRWAGIGTGLAAAIKITPAFFILYLLLTRRYRAAATATGTAAVATLLGLLAGPHQWWRYWTSLLWQTDRVGSLDSGSNQSLAGLLTRLRDLTGTPATEHPDRVLWLVLCAVLVGVGLWRARQAQLAGDDLAGWTLAGLTALVVAPITWAHHLYWVVPAVLILLDAGLTARGTLRWRHLTVAVLAYALFVSGIIHPFWHPPGHHGDDGLLGLLAENAYLLGCLALLVLLPARPGVDHPSPPPAAAGAGRELVEVGRG